MAGLFTNLNQVVGALNAQSRAIETSGRNLANVNNSNYARQRVVFGSAGTLQTDLGAQSMGLEATGIEQLRDALLDKQVVREVGLTAKLTTAQLALQKTQAAVGQNITSASSAASNTTTTKGIGDCMSDFFGSFSSLAASPTDVGVRQTLLQNAQILVDRFNLTDTRLTQVQNDLTDSVKTDVASVNTILSDIAKLNQQIGSYEVNSPGSAVDLRDSRQAKLEQLGKIMNFETRADPAGNGQIQVYTKDDTNAELLLVGATSSATLALAADNTTITATNVPGAATPATSFNLATVTSGSIAGALETRDGAVATVRNQIDTLARQLVTAVNGAYPNFFDLAPAGGTTSGVTAGNITLSSSITYSNLAPDLTSGANTGDNTIPNAVAAIASQKFSTVSPATDLIDGTLSQYYASTISGLGQSLSGSTSQLTDQSSIESLVRSQRDAVSGVSLDEEMSDLLKYQRAFQANARVFSTIDSLLESVVNLGNA